MINCNARASHPIWRGGFEVRGGRLAHGRRAEEGIVSRRWRREVGDRG